MARTPRLPGVGAPPASSRLLLIAALVVPALQPTAALRGVPRDAARSISHEGGWEEAWDVAAALDGLRAATDVHERAVVAAAAAAKEWASGNWDEQGKARPVAFVPGLMGTALRYGVKDREKSPNPFCRRNVPDGTLFWPPTKDMVMPQRFSCLCANLQLVCDDLSDTSETGCFRPKMKGVNISVDGSYASVMSLDNTSAIWQPWADALVAANPTYVQGRDIVGLPYDWRLGPDAWAAPGGDFDRTKAAIEAAVAANGGLAAVVVSISMGGPYFAAFCQHVSQEWKDANVHAFLSLSGVYSGSSLSFLNMLTGAFGTAKIPPFVLDEFKDMTRSLGSLPWLLPSSPTFPPDETFVSVQDPPSNYTANDFGSLLETAGATQAAKLWKRYKDVSGLNLAPNVTTYCVSGYGKSTLQSLTFASADFKMKKIVGAGMVDGDGTVATPSLRVCDAWAAVQRAPVFPVHVPNMTHAGFLADRDMGKILFPLVFDQRAAAVSS